MLESGVHIFISVMYCRQARSISGTDGQTGIFQRSGEWGPEGKWLWGGGWGGAGLEKRGMGMGMGEAPGRDRLPVRHSLVHVFAARWGPVSKQLCLFALNKKYGLHGLLRHGVNGGGTPWNKKNPTLSPKALNKMPSS